MNNLIERMQRLIDFRKQIGKKIDHHFLPGLSREEIKSKISGYPFYFPESFEELYIWYNGTRDEEFLMIRDMAWLSLDNAIAGYESMLKYFWPEIKEMIELDPAKLFPFAGFNGQFLFLTYPGQQEYPNAPLPIICAGAGGVLDPYFTSLELMLDTVLEWYKNGNHNEYSCEIDSDLEISIWRKYNSEVINF